MALPLSAMKSCCLGQGRSRGSATRTGARQSSTPQVQGGPTLVAADSPESGRFVMLTRLNDILIYECHPASG